MKHTKTYLTLLFAATASLSSSADHYNLQELADGGRLEVVNRNAKTEPAEYPETVYLSMAANDGLAWIKDVTFSKGNIELELKGANRPGQSFVGIAFHGDGTDAFDAVYLRPFNFRNTERRNHSLQYISLPQYNWSSLRDRHPGKYESSLDPAPAADDWVKLKLSIEGDRLAVFIDDAVQPELEVQLLNPRLDGRVGLWVGNRSDGFFRKLRIEDR